MESSSTKQKPNTLYGKPMLSLKVPHIMKIPPKCSVLFLIPWKGSQHHAPHYLQESSNRTSENLEKKFSISIPNFAHPIYPLLAYSVWCMRIHKKLALGFEIHSQLRQRNMHHKAMTKPCLIDEPKKKHRWAIAKINETWSKTTPPMLSQYSRSQALVKKEGCDRRGEPTLNLDILMEINPKENRWDVTLLATRHIWTRVWC